MISVNEDVIKYQRKLIDTFSRTIDFLEDNHLRWWCAYGTAIGAVRHHGIIPWDDDIDIFMPYDDYSRFLKITDAESYNLQIDIPLSENNVCPWAKITDTNSTIWQLEYIRSISGVWIDVFPLFSTNKTQRELQMLTKKYHSLYAKYQNSVTDFVPHDFIMMLKEFKLLNLKQRITSILFYHCQHTKIRNEFLDFLNSINEPSGQYLIAPQEKNDIFPKEWFDSDIVENFNGLKVKIPNGNDQILTQMFGDYMTPPPIESRITSHSFYFVDLNTKKSIQEIESLNKVRTTKNKNQQTINL